MCGHTAGALAEFSHVKFVLTSKGRRCGEISLSEVRVGNAMAKASTFPIAESSSMGKNSVYCFNSDLSKVEFCGQPRNSQTSQQETRSDYAHGRPMQGLHSLAITIEISFSTRCSILHMHDK